MPLKHLLAGSGVWFPNMPYLSLTDRTVYIRRKLQQKYAVRPVAADTPPENLLAMPPRLVAGTPAASHAAAGQQNKQQALSGIGRWHQQQQPGVQRSAQKQAVEPPMQQTQQRPRPTVRFAGVRSMSRSPAQELTAQQVGCAVTTAMVHACISSWLLMRGQRDDHVNPSSFELFNARAMHSQTSSAAPQCMARLLSAQAAAQQCTQSCRTTQAAEHQCMPQWTWQLALAQPWGLPGAGPHPQSCGPPRSGRRKQLRTLAWGL